MFRTGEKADFERMLDDILGRAKTAAVSTSGQVEAESAARGTLLSSGTPIVMEQRLTPIHETALTDAMRLIVQFSERTGIPIHELSDAAKTKHVCWEEMNTGLSEEGAKAAWRYLKDRGLIDTFNIPYTARINGAGIDAIEGAQRRPDQPSIDFPSVSYNIVYNTMNVGTMSNSPIQQGGVNSTQTQEVKYTAQE